MTRRNGTAAYRRFCVLVDFDVAFAAPRRAGAAFALAAAAGLRRGAAAAGRRLARAGAGAAARLRVAAATRGTTALAGRDADFGSGGWLVRCTSVKRI